MAACLPVLRARDDMPPWRSRCSNEGKFRRAADVGASTSPCHACSLHVTLPEAAGLVWVNSVTLTVNYGVKQNQFIKLTSQPRASDSKESNETFDRAIRGWLL